MRREDREVTRPEEIAAIVAGCEVLRLAFNDGDYPYLLPVSFGEEWVQGGLRLYFHGAPQGRKYAVMAADPRVSFEMDRAVYLPPAGEESCAASMAYESVIGRGTVRRLPACRREEALRRLMAHYGEPNPVFSPAMVAGTEVCCIEVTALSAKRRPRG